jgi:beta-glucosidase
MSYPRYPSLLVFSAISLFLAAGCPAPLRNGGGGGSQGTGSGGYGNPSGGSSGAGSGGSNTGTGGEIILTGTGGDGSGGTSASGGAGGTSGSGGSVASGGSSGSGGSGTGGALVKMACGSSTSDPLPYTAGYTADATNRSNAMSLANAMSNQERAQQMSGVQQNGTANYNVFKQEDNTTTGHLTRGWWFRDGPRGVNLNATGDGKSDYSTAFPVAIGRGAAFDVDLENKVGQAIGDEMLASGNTMMLAPTVNILRHPAWGRSQETYGEDSFLLGRLGSAFVMGIQNYVGACVKHYAANDIEDGRGNANAIIDPQTLREKFGRHFGMIVEEGGASSVMASYNAVNGTHSTQNGVLLTDMLRTEFGFQGFVLTDWWAMNGSSAPACCNPGSAADTLVKNSVNAGLDMELPWRYNFLELPNLVTSGGLLASQLVTSTAKILEQKYRFHADLSSGFGIKSAWTNLDSGSGSILKNDQTDPALGVSHTQLAEQAAEEAMVLLKNDSNTLPLSRTAIRKIAVVGATVSYSLQQTSSQDQCSTASTGISCNLDFTTNVRTGDDGSSRVFSDPAKSVGPSAGIAAAATGITVKNYSSASAAMSDGFDVAVVIAGLTPGDEGEEYTGAGDRTTGGITATTHTVNLALDPKVGSGTQDNLIKQVAAIGKPTIVVLEAGGIVDMSQWYSSVQAVVMAWYPGMEGGTALGRLLFGDVNFTGKLPVTWDTTVGHWPTFAGTPGGSSTDTTMGYYVGYQYFDTNGTALTPSSGSFPFGYGLSYTTFNYQNLQVPCSTVKPDGEVDVTVDVYNQSPVAGVETVFLFVQFPGSSVSTRAGASYKELKGFYRVSLAGMGTTGSAKRITIPLRVKDLNYWNTTTNAWAVEPGMVKVIVAPNANATSTLCAGGSGVGCGLSDTFMVTQ